MTLFALPLTQPVPIFMLVLVVMLCAPLIFRPLKIPNIVGMILAGVAIGPYGFNLLDRDASFQIFGQVGILYLMFLAAIEIDMYHLKQNLRHGALYGLLTFLLPFGVGIMVMKTVFASTWATSVLVASMFSSHTLVSYPVVSRFGLANNKGAVIAVCGTIIAVLLSLLALAEVVDVRTTGEFGWGRLVKLLLFTAVFALSVGWLFPIMTRWFFRKVSDSVGQFIFILAEVFLASLFAEVIGLESILGAFYGGLVLNRFIPSRSALMRNISFVGNAIFIPYFLIGVGMLINIHVIFKGWGVGLAASVMTLTALSTKYIAVLISKKIFRLDRDESNLMFGLSAGKAAATIAATMIGYQYGLLSEDMMNGAVVMILFCCIVASMTTERAAKRIRISLADKELRADEHHSPGFARQIVAVSNPLTAEGITKMAVFMRNPDNAEPIATLYVRNSDNGSSIAMGRNALQSAVRAVSSMDLPVNEIERFDLNISAGLTNAMRERNATDLVIGFHRRANPVDSFFGSLTESLLKQHDRMIILSRCFIPVDTVRKLVVYIPKNAEYEKGFHSALARIGNLASQLGCRVVFFLYATTEPFVENFIIQEKFSFSRDYRVMESWDDFIILSSQVTEEDLMIIVGARKGSLSHSSDMDSFPSFISRYFTRQNIVMIYPAQFADS